MTDQETLMNFSLHGFGRRDFNGQFINLSYVNMRCFFFRPQQSVPSRHSILTFAVSVILNFLEIKYQGKAESPFETHPKTMLVAVTSVILYCFSYDASLKVSSSIDQLLSNSYVSATRISVAFFGPLSLASLSSLLFPGRVCAVLFSVSILFSLCELPCSIRRILWNSTVQQVIRVMNLFPAELHRQERRGGRRRRSRIPASVYLSRLSVSEHANELMDQVDILPV